MTTPNRPATYQQALAEAAKIHAARDAAPDPVAVTAHMSEQIAQAREHAAGWAKQAIQELWLAVNPYDPAQVREFTAKAAGLMVSAQTATARAAAAAQSEQLAALGVPVSAAPSNPIDVRAPAAHIAGGKVRLRHGASTVKYDGAEGSAKVSAADMSTEKVFERPAALFRYLISIGEPNADDQALLRISGLVDDNLMLAQRLAQQEVLAKAVDLDHRGGGRGRRRSKIIGYRRVIRPELSRGGTCGMCIAASDRLYKVGELLPIHRRCHCTISAVTEEHDPADDLNAVDLNALYKAAGGTSAAHLKRTRYKVDQHGELGPVLVSERKYKPRSETARKQSGGTAVSAPESKAQIAERLLPGLEKNLQDLRAKGLAEDSPQITYHKDTIERLRSDLKASGGGAAAGGRGAGKSSGKKPEQDKPAAGGGGGGRPPTNPPPGPAAVGGEGDDRIPEDIRRHILDGDPGGGGGHRHNSTARNKTLFPASWDDDKVVAAIAETLDRHYTTSDDHPKLADPNFRNLYAIVDGVRMLVRINKADNSIITAHPLDGEGVYRTGKRPGVEKKQLPLGIVKEIPLPDGRE